MKLEDGVCDLEYAEKFKELGLRQDKGINYYCYFRLEGKYKLYSDSDFKGEDPNEIVDFVYAPTTTELGVMLPNQIVEGEHLAYWNELRDDKEYTVYYERPAGKTFAAEEDKKEANARAKMLIYLIENKLITIEKVNKRLEE